MGDRCWLRIIARSSDWSEHFYQDFGDPDDDDSISASAEVDESNYGQVHERDLIAKKKIPFMGWHGAGDGYAGCIFCSPGDGEMYELDLMGLDGPGVPLCITSDGKVVPGVCALADAQEFIDKLRETERVLCTNLNMTWWENQRQVAGW